MSELKVNHYDVVLLKSVDGDTVDVDIDLGFGVWLRNERVRIMGIDTPESRTSNEVEKLFGKAAKARLKELLQNGAVLVTTEEASGEDMRGKFGRILGDFKLPDGRLVTEVMVAEGHCVPYFGGSKDDVQSQHAINRDRLLNEGVVDRTAYEKALSKKEK